MPNDRDGVVIFWCLPASSRGSPIPDHDAYQDLRRIAVAADRLGFDGLVLQTECEAAWTYAAAVATATERLSFLIPVRPAGMEVASVVRLASSLDRITNGRVLLHLGSDPALGPDPTDTADQQTAAFLRAWQHHADAGGLAEGVGPRRLPPLWLAGSTAAGAELAARHASTCVLPGEAPDGLRARIALLRVRAAACGRNLRFAVRLTLVVRKTAAAAEAAAASLQGRTRGPILAGSPEQVAARLREYRAVGIDALIASGMPPLEEACHVAELLFPVLGNAGAAPPPARPPSSFSLDQLRMAAQSYHPADPGALAPPADSGSDRSRSEGDTPCRAGRSPTSCPPRH